MILLEIGREPRSSCRSARLYVDDLARGVCGLEEAVDVGAVSGDHVGAQIGGSLGDDGVDNVAGGGAAHELAGGMGFLFGQGDDLASAQEPPKLDLGAGAADLSDDGRGNYGDDPGFQPDPVVGPHRADAAVGGDQDPGVVDDLRHAVRRWAMPARRRAATAPNADAARRRTSTAGAQELGAQVPVILSLATSTFLILHGLCGTTRPPLAATAALILTYTLARRCSQSRRCCHSEALSHAAGARCKRLVTLTSRRGKPGKICLGSHFLLA